MHEMGKVGSESFLPMTRLDYDHMRRWRLIMETAPGTVVGHVPLLSATFLQFRLASSILPQSPYFFLWYF